MNLRLLARVCGQFGSDAAPVRVAAAGHARRMLSSAGTDWTALLGHRPDGLDQDLIRLHVPDEEVTARIALEAYGKVLARDGTWEAALGCGGDEAGQGSRHRRGGTPWTDAELMAAMMPHVFEALSRVMEGYGHWQARSPHAHGRQWSTSSAPSPPRGPVRLRGKDVPVVITGTLERVGEENDARGNPVLLFLVHDGDRFTYGPLEARKAGIRHVMSGACGSRVRVTSRKGSGDHSPREVTRAVLA